MVLTLMLAILAVVASAAVLLPLWRRGRPSGDRAAVDRATLDRATFDRQVFRDQLRELDAEQQRGVISAAEADAARLEIERRILATAAPAPDVDRQPAQTTGGARRWRVQTGVALFVCGMAALIYGQLGSPRLPDQPLASRDQPANDVAGMPVDLDQAIASLRSRLQDDPDDPAGWKLLGRSLTVMGRFDEAIDAYRKANALDPDDLDAAVALAESIVQAAAGAVTPAAQAQFDAVLARAPDNVIARYYVGLGRAQAGDESTALQMWTAILHDASPGEPWLDALRQQVISLAEQVGVPVPEVALAPAPQTSGPSAADRAAAEDMTADERQEMVLSMVARLESRLAETPDDVDGWKRLGRAKQVLGDAEAAQAAYAKAVALAPEDLESLNGLAETQMAGVDPNHQVPAEAVTTFEKILAVDSGDPAALWFLGLAALQNDRPDDGLAYWQRLLARLPPESEEHRALSERIERMKTGG